VDTSRAQCRDALGALVAKGKAKHPELAGRLEKAATLVLNGDVTLLDNGEAEIFSSSECQVTYHTNGSCTCADVARAPGHYCKHRLALLMATRLQELVSVPPDDGQGETPPVAGLPEAPASVNVRLVIEGREVQWTLRDTDEDRLAGRLAALLARFPVERPAPPQAPATPDEGFCVTHNTPMSLNTKAGKQWWSHKLPEGGFCKGKGR
jgi:hypothetical protein